MVDFGLSHLSSLREPALLPQIEIAVSARASSMGKLVAGIFAIVLTFLTVALGFVALMSPTWVTTSTVDPSWTDRVKRVESTLGIWAVCVDVDFSNKGVLIPNNETVSDFSFKTCYTYFTPMATEIVRIESTITKDSYRDSVCAHLQLNENRATEALAIMTGIKASAMHDFLASTCSASGKAVLGLVATATALNFLALVLLVCGIVCCRETVSLLWTAKLFVNLSILCSVVMTFLVFRELRTVKLSGPGISYGAPVYFEFASFFIACFAGCAIETFEAKTKKAQNVSDMDKRLEAKIREQNLISKRHHADIV
ncbi:Aste57867_13300 [Aphanomyces stellatus]|uniref:Aste57867_13300 protein n=1 Tax=Aphanomyces stellatus TaxID=120398 RepID=A0A485KZT7_9STRA|nr:hypothetical protein As57867_013251 [Aphanomyces stellatus]VFT90139.1 Aste57867_13300 [Aphanomyces stellatus]